MRIGLSFLGILISLGCVSAQPGWGNADLSVDAGKGKYDIRQYNSENGLPQNSASDLLLDHNNFLWIATQNGIVRFDGQRFRLYNPSNTPALKVSRISVISETLEHTVLFRSSFDASEIYTVTPDYRIQLDSATTRLPHKLISSHSNGVFNYDHLFRYYGQHKDPVIDTAFLKSLCSSDTYWILNQHEAVIFYHEDWYYLNDLTAGVVRLSVKPEHTASPPEFFIGNIFCIVRSNGRVLAFKNGLPIDMQVDPLLAGLLKEATALPSTQFFVYTKGDQLILRRHNDLYTMGINGDTLTAAPIFKDLGFLENLFPVSLQYDKRSKRLFLGTLNAGLFVVTKKIFHTLTFKTGNLIDNSFMAFQTLPDGDILCHNGILDIGNGERSRLFKEEDRSDKNCIYKASDRSIWLSRGKRLYKYDPNFSGRPMMDSMSLDSYVTSIVEDHAHTTWISTLYSLLKIEGGKLKNVLNRHPPFTYHTIESTAEVLPGKLWIATRNGLYSYDIAANRMDERPVLPHVYVRSIFKARDNSIFIGTYGNGFFKYQDTSFIPLPLDPEKYLATAHAFLEDDHGFFWISTNHGLFKILKKDLDSFSLAGDQKLFYYYYDRSYGWNTNEFNGGCNPAALKDGAGIFYFPSINGLVCFNPDSSRPELPDKTLAVDNFSVDSFSRDYRQPLALDPGFNRIEVEVVTPFYGAPENLRIEYKLNDVDGKWYPVNRDGKIVINRLPHGKYSLLVRKAGGWGMNNFTYSGISFEVLPHWYHTRWFYVLLAGGLILMALLAYQLRAGILIRQNDRLQAKVNERTSELEQSTIIKEKLISVIMHDLRSPLFSQDLLLGHLYDQHYRLTAGEISEMLLQLRDSSKRICQFSTDFLVWYNTQQKGFSVRRQPIELSACIMEASVFYRGIAERQGLTFEYDIPPGLILHSDRNMLTIVIRNLVDNAVKYTRSGSIHITAFSVNGDMYIKVRDTGRGIPAEKIRELMSYPERNINDGNSTFGYRFIMELTRQLKGNVSIESEPHAGTEVTLAFKT